MTATTYMTTGVEDSRDSKTGQQLGQHPAHLPTSLCTSEIQYYMPQWCHRPFQFRGNKLDYTIKFYFATASPLFHLQLPPHTPGNRLLRLVRNGGIYQDGENSAVAISAAPVTPRTASSTSPVLYLSPFRALLA